MWNTKKEKDDNGDYLDISVYNNKIFIYILFKIN